MVLLNRQIKQIHKKDTFFRMPIITWNYIKISLVLHKY